MGLRVESQAEPIPGYRLIERLGGGGFGEVWKAEAPGGLFKAIKFVYGELGPRDGDGIQLGDAENDDASRAEQEFKALNRVKSVHHPFILSLEQFHIIDNQLVIVMELADRTLWDRFRECRQQGLPGIPRDELLQYLLETAEALDLMNSHYQLQHLDIKPQNLFLVFNHVKVADFGLVKDLEGMHATVTGGVTPVYAAPETFDGWISRFSDQYSLAIVYQELLTGQRPFTGTTIRQLVMQHLQGRPNLSSLLMAEQPVIARALSKNPEHRYPTCMEFVQSLRVAVANHGNVVPALPVLPPEAAASPPPLPALPGEVTGDSSAENSELVTQNARGRWQPNKALEHATPAAPAPSVLPPRPAKQSGIRKKQPQDTPSTVQDLAKVTPGRVPSTKTPAPAEESGGVFRPALVIGVGRMGLTVLKQLRKELNEQFGSPDNLPHLRLLHLDTDPESQQLAGHGKMDYLLPGETLLTRLQRPAHYLKAHLHESWLDTRVLYRIPRSRNYAGLRPLGRLAFVENHRAVGTRLEACLATISAPASLQHALQKTGLGPRSTAPRVYIVTSLTGGTGSGMFLDLAYMVRRLLRDQGQEQAELVGLFLVPHGEAESSQALGVANTHAAYAELLHFSGRDTVFPVRYESNQRHDEQGAPFEHCLLLPLPESRAAAPAASAEEPLLRAGHFLFTELATPLGAALEEARRQADCAADFGNPVGYHSVGSYRIVWPRRQVLAQTAHLLCTRLAQHWMSKEGAHVRDELQGWAREQWEGQGLRPENLIARQQEHCQSVLEQAPETLFAEIIDPVAQALAGARGGENTLQLGPVVQALDNLEKLLGVPEDGRGQGSTGVNTPEPSPIEKATQEAARALAHECEHKLAELVVLLFEEPRYRLAGAEELIRQLGNCVQQALESQESLCRELEQRTHGVHQRLHMLLEAGAPPSPHTTPRWKSPFGRRTVPNGPSGPELLELLRTFAKCRYQSVTLQYINGLYVRLRGYLSDQMREIGFCRTRLLELKELLRGRMATLAAAPAGDQVLLPENGKNIDGVAKQLDAGVGVDDLLHFDKQAQQLIVQQYRGLVEVCMAPSTVVAALTPLLVQEAEHFLEPLLEGANIAEMYLGRYPEGEQGEADLEADLLAAFDEAVPELGSVPPEREICLIALPAGDAADQLRTLISRVLPQALLITVPTCDELLIVRAYQRIDPANIEPFGPAGEEAYRARLAQDPCSLHSRIDIPAWRPEDLAVS